MKTAAWARFPSFPPSPVLWVRGTSFHGPWGAARDGGPSPRRIRTGRQCCATHGLPCPLWASFPQCPGHSLVLKLDEDPTKTQTHSHIQAPLDPHSGKIWKNVFFWHPQQQQGQGISSFLFVCFGFGGPTWQCSQVILYSMLWDQFWKGSGDPKRYPGLNPGWVHARQKALPLYTLSLSLCTPVAELPHTIL